MMEDQEALAKRSRDLERKLSDGVANVLNDGSIYNDLVRNLVRSYSSDLDSLSDSLETLISRIRRGDAIKYSDMQLDMRCLALSQALYTATDGLGTIGGQSDVARMDREKRFAEIYRGIVQGTIPDKKAIAEEQILDEKQIEALFQRAYINLAAKIRAGNRVLEAVKKIMTSRMIAFEVFRKELSDDFQGEIDGEEDPGDLPGTGEEGI